MKKVCAVYDIRRLDEIVLLVKNKICEFADRKLQNIYHAAPFKFTKEIEKLTIYLPILERHRRSLILGFMPCLCDYEMQCLWEKIVGITGVCKTLIPDIQIDESGEEAWALKNPNCRTYQEWEKLSRTLCGEIDLQITTEQLRCDIVFDISREVISCDVLLAISAFNEATELDMTIDRTQEECEIDYKLLIESIPHCDLDLKTYLEFIKNNVSFDVMKVIYNSGLNLTFSQGSVAIKTPMNVVPLAQMAGNINVSYLEKFGLRPTKTKSDLLQDYK